MVYIGTDGQAVEIEIDNTLIHGTVQVSRPRLWTN